MFRCLLLILLSCGTAHAETPAEKLPLSVVTAALGRTSDSDALKAVTKAIGKEPHVDQHPWGLFYNWNEYGLSLRIDKGVVSAIFLSVAEKDGFKPYLGELPGGLQL